MRTHTLGLIALILATPSQAGVITLGPGVMNPPPNVSTVGVTPPLTAIAYTASVVATPTSIIQATLNAQGFTSANNWSLVSNAVTLDPAAAFNLTTYKLTYAGGNALGEQIQFTLSPNLAQPTNVPMGSTVTEHWLSLLNESTPVHLFGFGIPGQSGYWKFDNGDVVGGLAVGAGSGPYYDSNNGGATFSTPPTFLDGPSFPATASNGFYFKAVTIPVWDVYTPGTGDQAAKESIDVADYGVSWGLMIVPEPSPIVLVVLASACALPIPLRHRRTEAA